MHRYRKIEDKDKKKDTSASTAKIAVWYVFSNFFVKGLSMISAPIFTRMMSQEEYGQFSNFTSWESILIIIVTLDFETSIARAKYDFQDRIDEYMSSILVFSNIVTISAYVFVEMNHIYFEKLFSMDMRYIRMMFVYFLFMPAFSYLQTKHRIYRKYKFFVASSIGTAVISTTISVLLVLLMNEKLLARIYGTVVPLSLFNMILWITVIAKGRKVSWECIKYACAISVPLVPHALSSTILGNSDRIMITNFCGSESTALYSVAYSVSMLGTLLWTAMNRAWTPWLYDNMNENKALAIRNNSKIYLGVFSLLIIGIFLGAPEIITVLGGQKYISAKYVMPPVILGCAFQFVYGMYVNIELYVKKTFVVSIGTMAAAALNVLLNRLFIPKYGYIAAAYTTLVGYFMLLVVHYCIVKKFIKEYSDIYDKKFVFSVIFLFIALGGISLVLYQYNFVRYILIMLYGVAMSIGVYRYRGKIRHLFR